MLTKYEIKLKEIDEMMASLGEKIIKANEVILEGLINGDYSKFEKTKESLSGIKDEARSIDKKYNYDIGIICS